MRQKRRRTQTNSPLGTQMCGMPLISITRDLDVGIRSKKEKETDVFDGMHIRAIRTGVKPAPQSLSRQQAGHFHARPTAGPIDDRDGAPMGVVVNRALRLLRRVRDDFVALASSRVDDRRVQHVRTEVGDVEHGRVGVRGLRVRVRVAAPGGGGGRGGSMCIAPAGHREGPEDRGRLSETTG